MANRQQAGKASSSIGENAKNDTIGQLKGQLKQHDQSYSMARYYLEEADWDIEQAYQMYLQDQEWEKQHPQFARNSIIKKRILEEMGRLDPTRQKPQQ